MTITNITSTRAEQISAEKPGVKPLCAVENCGNPVRHKTTGFCNRHYLRVRRHGSPHGGGPRSFKSPEEAFAARTSHKGGCLVWTGAVGSHGYGQISVNQTQVLAHRYAWERANGPIPEGMFIDHTCHNRKCVDIQHLRIATMQQNNQNQPGSHRGRTLKRGVYLDRRSGKYYVQVRHNGETIYRGTFDSPDVAGKAAEEIRSDLFGAFAGGSECQPDLIKQHITERAA